MQKRILLGIVAVLSVLAVQDGFFGVNSHDTALPEAASAPTIGRLTQMPELPLVTRIVDGDTIVVGINGMQEKIRLIGVDTPETVDPRKPVQCFGKEASAFSKSLLLNMRVRLERDASQGDRDKYGRLLRYVFLEDGTLVNQKIILEGYGHEYTYRIPYQYQTEFKNAERSARESQKGLWAREECKK
ncbi:MAG: thermonuclease family protein [Candidatus Yonathbacteria bacterium]|nr:thermonuclease family protein [Candidatus Yonathbacteria bacterium]